MIPDSSLSVAGVRMEPGLSHMHHVLPAHITCPRLALSTSMAYVTSGFSFKMSVRCLFDENNLYAFGM